MLERTLIGLQRYAPLGRSICKAQALRSLARCPYVDIEVSGIRASHLPPGGTYTDIGANFDLYTLPAVRAIGRSGRVLAIEPNPTMAGRLRFNIIETSWRHAWQQDCLGVMAHLGYQTTWQGRDDVALVLAAT